MGKHDLPAVTCVQPLRDLAAAVFKGLGRMGPGQMLGTVHIGCAIGVVMTYGIQQGLGFCVVAALSR